MSTLHELIQSQVEEKLAHSMTVQELSFLMQSYAQFNASLKPNVLHATDFSDVVLNTKQNYFFPSLNANIQLLVVNGLIIQKSKWTWNSADFQLHLEGAYRIPNGAKAEIYYFFA